jgi:hypothetical protein
VVDDRWRARLVQEIQQRLPCVTALLIRVGADSDTADAEAAEEQSCRVELEHFASEPPDDADAPSIAQACFSVSRDYPMTV